jgi:hypothetical protein
MTLHGVGWRSRTKVKGHPQMTQIDADRTVFNLRPSVSSADRPSRRTHAAVCNGNVRRPQRYAGRRQRCGHPLATLRSPFHIIPDGPP